MPRLPHDPRPSSLDAEAESGLDNIVTTFLSADTDTARFMQQSWRLNARPAQTVRRSGWDIWLMMAGRGFGKTRAGAEWVKELIGDPRHKGPKSNYRIALVAATLHEVRTIMVEGESGILALYGEELEEDRPRWEPSRRQLTWPNGARAFIYGAADADSLRGAQHHFAWCDEIAKWPDGLTMWMNLRMGLRLGLHPRILATTTPRHCEFVTNLVQSADENATIFISGGKTEDNLHLPRVVRKALRDEYGGTILGRQELDGELIDTVRDPLWTRAVMTAARARYDPALPLRRVVIGVDPSTTAKGDSCGIIVAGLLDPAPDAPAGHSRALILADETIGGVPPEGWARRVAEAAARWDADLVIAESNQGGKMVESVLFAACASLPVRLTHASRGKSARAEPVSVWYDHGRVAHAAAFPVLEDQLCGMTRTQGYQGPGPSPDRADALVYAVTALLGRKGLGDGPRVWSW